jgi:transposase
VKALRRRDDYFANVVADLSRRYKTAIVEDFDLRNVMQIDPTQTEQIGDGRQRYRARVASAGGFRQMVKNRFAETQIVSAALTTQTCTECSEVMNFNAAEDVFGKCPHCGHAFDQDRAAAINLMRRYEEGLVAANGEVR